MPRTARKQSRTGIYHVMLRGINKQQIFHDEEDCLYFLKLLDRFKKPCGYSLYAYCLMGNHVHLLLKECGEVPVGGIFRHIGSSYVYWYNLKYERTGHLFQDRFRSEPVEDDGYLLTVFRYILLNPVKAGLCSQAEQYKYSSAGEYLNGKKGITDTAFIRETLGSWDIRELLSQPDDDDQCMEMEEKTARTRVTDETAEEMIRKDLGGLHVKAGKAKERQALNAGIGRLIRAGISIRQLSRLTGISKKIIENALNQ